jgi:hypothetical protein
MTHETMMLGLFFIAVIVLVIIMIIFTPTPVG